MIGGAAGAGQEGFANKGLGHDAGNGNAIMGKADQRAPDRHAGDEGAGAIDGIDDPGVFAVARIAPFLADNGVVGEIFANDGANGGLGAAIGLGDRIKASGELVVDTQIGAEQRQGFGRGGVGGGQQGGFDFGEIDGHEWSVLAMRQEG